MLYTADPARSFKSHRGGLHPGADSTFCICCKLMACFKARIRFLCEEAARDEDVICKKVMILIALILHCTFLFD
nr:hypothetical protein CFP56_49192 [Quercus suber]